MPRLNRRLVAGVLLAVVALLLARARRGQSEPAPFPASQRLLLALPRPFLNRDRLRRLLTPRPGERILELGPGAGYYTLDIASHLRPDGRLDALDLQSEMLQAMMRRAASDGLDNVFPVQGDARALPFPDRTFDAVFLVATLGEIPQPESALREMRRVLKPGGRLIVGEGQPDPHMIPLAELKPMARQAQVRYDQHEGGRLGYATRFLTA
jgi:ubiquinone/menaquinone biosynthesis C-methylase UbiE